MYRAMRWIISSSVTSRNNVEVVVEVNFAIENSPTNASAGMTAFDVYLPILMRLEVESTSSEAAWNTLPGTMDY